MLESAACLPEIVRLPYKPFNFKIVGPKKKKPVPFYISPKDRQVNSPSGWVIRESGSDTQLLTGEFLVANLFQDPSNAEKLIRSDDEAVKEGPSSILF